MARTGHTSGACFRIDERYMAKLPVTIPELVAQFGPTLNRIPANGWNADVEPIVQVKTHCCFCGQRCGIQLKVKDNP
jgi:assimilatory nitrate reductase catalytic subunit